MIDNVSSDGYTGRANETTWSDEYNAISFLINQVLSGKWTITLCQVKSVSGGGIAAPPIVSAQPLVNQVDGQGNPTPHGVVNGIPAFRLQCGTNAIIADPLVGDIGILACASNDISSVKANKAPSNPGSFRTFSASDGIYIGGVLGATPTQYVQFTADGINIVDKNGNKVTTSATGIDIKDANNNEVTTSSSGIVVNAAAGTFELEDKAGNKIQSSSSGIAWTDVSGNNLSSSSAGISINGINFNRSQQITTNLDVEATLRVGTGNLIVVNSLQLAGAILNISGGEYTGNFATSGIITAADANLAGTTYSTHEHQYLLATGTPTSPAQTGAPV